MRRSPEVKPRCDAKAVHVITDLGCIGCIVLSRLHRSIDVRAKWM